MKTALFPLFAFIFAILSLPVQAELSHPMLVISMSGEALSIDMPEHPPEPPMRLQDPWYSVSLDGSDLVLERSETTRRPDWSLSVRNTGTASTSSSDTRPVRHAVDMPGNALLAFRAIRWISSGGKEDVNFKPGKYTSFLPLPEKLHDRWKQSFNKDGKIWTVSTESIRRKDGALLAGSLALVATSDTGERRILVPPAHGMAFEKQELLWLGSLGPHSDFDVLLKRTWVTGEIDYILNIGQSLGCGKFDPDYPHSYFSQGIDEYEGINTHFSQQRPLPTGNFGSAAFSIPEEEWNQAVYAATEKKLPELLFDRKLTMNSESVRTTIEYLPRLEFEAWLTPSSRCNDLYGKDDVLVKVHFRGKSQTLLQIGTLDGTPFRLQVGMLDGEPALEISWYPHYNNGFVYYWVWSEKEGRFLRLSKAHSQGC
jgi:hypothetical protein